MAISGVMPLPAPINTTVRLLRASASTIKCPIGSITSKKSSAFRWSLSQFDTKPLGTRFTVTAGAASVCGELDME